MSTAKRKDPALWERVKKQVTAGDKGGDKGQWSARKAQLAVAAYKREGGTYEGPKREDNDLRQWTKEDWGTRSGEESGASGERYLPRKARAAVSKEEYARTTEKKRADKRAGKQFSKQPADVARKTAPYRKGGKGDGATKASLLAEARRKDVPGRSRMSKEELRHAVGA